MSFLCTHLTLFCFRLISATLPKTQNPRIPASTRGKPSPPPPHIFRLNARAIRRVKIKRAPSPHLWKHSGKYPLFRTLNWEPGWMWGLTFWLLSWSAFAYFVYCQRQLDTTCTEFGKHLPKKHSTSERTISIIYLLISGLYYF